MKKLTISEVISQAWELTKKHWATVLVCFIAMFVVQFIINAIMGGSQALDVDQMIQNQKSQDPATNLQQAIQMLQQNLAASMVCMVINFILSVGLYQILLNCARGNGNFTIDAWKQPGALFAKLFVAEIIASFVVLVGFCCCILPGIYLYSRLQFFPYYMLDHKDCGVMDGIEASWKSTKENDITLCLLFFVFILIMILGVLCCCVGMFVAEILVSFAVVVRSLTLNSEEPKLEVTE